MGEVEEGGRLVEEQIRGLLGQHHGDPHPPALAAGELLDAPLGQFGDAGGRHRLGHGLSVCRGPGGQQRLVRVAAPGHELAHQGVLGRRQPLREEAELAGRRPGAPGVQILAAPADGPGVRSQEPDEPQALAPTTAVKAPSARPARHRAGHPDRPAGGIRQPVGLRGGVRQGVRADPGPVRPRRNLRLRPPGAPPVRRAGRRTGAVAAGERPDRGRTGGHGPVCLRDHQVPHRRGERLALRAPQEGARDAPPRTAPPSWTPSSKSSAPTARSSAPPWTGGSGPGARRRGRFGP